MKKCNRCGEAKPFTEMKADKTCPDGVRPLCKDCYRKQQRERHRRAKSDPDYMERLRVSRRRHDLKREYGITPEEYEAMILVQGGRCAICNNECSSGKRLAVDHCHDTGEVRGLLCTCCNTALGKFRDDVELLKKAIKYLESR